MSVPSPTPATQPAATGLRLIIGYKLAKAGAEVIAGGSLFFLGSAGATEKLVHAAQTLRHHATEPWSIALAEKLLDASTARHIFVVALALIADGIVTAVEGWALYRRYAWSHWLVVVTTASLVPFELIGLTHHFNAVHVLLLLLNLLIVAYLLRHLTVVPRH